MKELNAKNFALVKTTKIIQLCDDLKYVKNKELRIFGIEKIQKLAKGIEEHLEYLDVKEAEKVEEER